MQPWTPCSVRAACFNGNGQGLQRLREELLRADNMLLAGEEAVCNEAANAANANFIQQLVLVTAFCANFVLEQF